MAAATRIFEDAEADAKSSTALKPRKRTPSVGQFLRGRKNKENDPPKVAAHNPASKGSETPLGERHINSPPQARRILVRDDIERPAIHKKTKSSLSLKSLIKDKSVDLGSTSSSDGSVENHKPKKSKSSTNLKTLLKKKSKKNLNAEPSTCQENITPPSSAGPDTTRSPVWAQFATQPLEDQEARLHHPSGTRRAVLKEIELYTSRSTEEYGPSQHNGFHETPTPLERPVQPPFLEHQSSRSSIFKEELDSGNAAQQDQAQVQHCASRETRPRLESQPSHPSQPPQTNEKRSSRVMNALATLDFKSRHEAISTPKDQKEESRQLSEQEINSALESLLDARNIAPNMRNQMRALDMIMKLKLIRNQREGSGSSNSSQTPTATDNEHKERSNSTPRSREEGDSKEAKQSRSRPRSRAFTLTKRDDGGSPIKKPKGDESIRSGSKNRPKSVDMSSFNEIIHLHQQFVLAQAGHRRCPRRLHPLFA